MILVPFLLGILMLATGILLFALIFWHWDNKKDRVLNIFLGVFSIVICIFSFIILGEALTPGPGTEVNTYDFFDGNATIEIYDKDRGEDDYHYAKYVIRAQGNWTITFDIKENDDVIISHEVDSVGNHSFIYDLPSPSPSYNGALLDAIKVRWNGRVEQVIIG